VTARNNDWHCEGQLSLQFYHNRDVQGLDDPPRCAAMVGSTRDFLPALKPG
jgi:hypothetical protein